MPGVASEVEHRVLHGAPGRFWCQGCRAYCGTGPRQDQMCPCCAAEVREHERQRDESRESSR